MKQISVIIPTFNRSKLLIRSLSHLERQSIGPSKFEVIVVNDGSKDDTTLLLQEFLHNTSLDLTIINQKNTGQGIARNTGLKHVKTPLVVFVQDDIFVELDFLEEHLSTHKKYPKENYACLGFIDWSPELQVTPLMRWLTSGACILNKYGGHQFAFDKLEGKKFADYNFFYTSNISLKTSLLEKDKFDESFNRYGWEDIELGFRLTKKHNLCLAYNKKAIGYHYHFISEHDFKKRMVNIGRSAHVINNKYPELHKVPNFKKKVIFNLLSNDLSINVLKALSHTNESFQNVYFYALSKKYFLSGLKDS